MSTETKPNKQGLSSSSIAAFVISGVLLIIAIAFFVSSSNRESNSTTPQSTQPATVKPVAPPASSPKTNCVDVTTYDRNWNNDVRCTRPDGSVFYTNYAGGSSNDPTFTRN